ncbi:hypothetical protein H5410_001862 [Solanum commersonii]|uniref:Uncharacterized protein n=1 Tax=Solanum commersonii TaxID=4109 RepID=A0A9J6B0D0_SOLCO|nr:hypothetical protein H5410_001862 [Solanum commersonii]
MLSAHRVLLSKEDPVMVEVIAMVVVVDIDVEVGDMVVVVVKVVRAVAGCMEMMVDMAVVVGGMVEVVVAMVAVVKEELGVTSVEKMVVLQGNVAKVVDMGEVGVGDIAAR